MLKINIVYINSSSNLHKRKLSTLADRNGEWTAGGFELAWEGLAMCERRQKGDTPASKTAMVLRRGCTLFEDAQTQ